ncbi:serine O-acetyltransferase [Teredinibacter turnerae]|uniref:serine O-acetyltransferase n=1 Tax=Teredinibacter turnerae TaxID=2426 RepID=UPI00036AD0D8|nr:serine O-acetyltransferase [Teredinibacter turnerae]
MTFSTTAMSMESKLTSIIYQHLTGFEIKCIKDVGLFPFGTSSTLVRDLMDDLQAFAEKDPAAGGRLDLLLENSSSFLAIVYYRIAHFFWLAGAHEPGMEHLAVRISEVSKRTLGIDIHHAARIGKRFVLDHAFGTVIGETCCIGKDCYILGGVILGAYGISGNASNKRHPTLGDRVQIGSNARLLGPIDIGDDVFISPNCVVTKSIPAGTRVSIVNQIQINKSHLPAQPPFTKVYGSLVHQNEVVLLCNGFTRLSASIVDNNHTEISAINVIPQSSHEHVVVLKMELLEDIDHSSYAEPLHLQLKDDGHEITLISPPQLTHMLRNMTINAKGRLNESA